MIRRLLVIGLLGLLLLAVASQRGAGDVVAQAVPGCTPTAQATEGEGAAVEGSADGAGAAAPCPEAGTTLAPAATEDGEMAGAEPLAPAGSSEVVLPLVAADLTTAGTTYYVDCVSGNDTLSGKAPGAAWRSMPRANRAALVPGDRLLFKRGCTWGTKLEARWVGTANQPITIGAYGSGELPKIQNGETENVKITGSYQIIESLQVRSDIREVDPNCRNQPLGWSVGFNFLRGAAYNTLRFSKASGMMAGVRIAAGSHHNKIVNNTLVDNKTLHLLDTTHPDNDLGAWGIIINGDDNEIAHNTLSGNNAICSYDYEMTGNSIEIYAGQRNVVHHNRSFNDTVFSELGGSATRKAEDNIYLYNLHVSHVPVARFLVVRGAESSWGPTLRTRAYNNTIHLTSTTSQGIVCHGGCSPSILTLRNNVIWANEKAAYADAPFDESHNIYWSSTGRPTIQYEGFAIHSTSRVADPQFVDPATQKYRLRSSSPALDRGPLDPVNLGYRTDLAGRLVPQGRGVDIGAYESNP